MIRVLEKNVADKIAAGEVIERPLSIVKELVENSIDSGANSIVVEIKNGGKTYIRVTDNGCGISHDDAPTAFLRHATSKIVKAQDLNSIKTLGFRGEALASIAAVTRTELISKTAESKVGTRILIHGGEKIDNSAIGCPEGTTLIVSDLFYNTPVRAKFLKSDSAESGQIIDFMCQIALAYLHIKFRFINNGNVYFSTDGKNNFLNTILAVYKQREYEDLVPVNYENDGIKITGYISKPSVSKSTRKNQIFFVNGRVVSSRIIEKGVSEGYKERMFDGRFPITFLFIYTNPENLDVNIHPNKKEIRFDNERNIIEAVSEAIVNALKTNTAVIDIKNSGKDSSFARKSQESFKENQVDIKQLLSIKRNTPITKETSITDIPDYRVFGDTSSISGKTTEKESLSIEIPVSKPFDFDDLTLTGSIFGTYITATDSNNFYLIDQHAAHERIFYENLVEEYLNSEKLRQPIFTPIIIEVSLAVKENEYDWFDSLCEMGFFIEPFGQNSYVIKEIPTFMDISEAEEFAKIYIENISEGTNLNNTVIINKLITKSCKSAVKAHDYLSIPEIKALIDNLKLCRNPFSCPHGRPTFIRLSNYEIEKMFKRV